MTSCSYVHCYDNIGTYVLDANINGVCPAGTSVTNPCLSHPVPGCDNWQPSNTTPTPTLPDGTGGNITPTPTPPNGTSLDLSGTQTDSPAPASKSFVPSNKASGLIPSDAEIAATGFTALAKFISNIITRIIQLSATIAAITFSYAGAQMLMHPDEESKRSEAKEMLIKTVWGMFIILGAWLVVNTVINTLVNSNITALRFFN
jgi:hypothetical protein